MLLVLRQLDLRCVPLRFPAAPHITLLDSRKPQAHPWPHANTSFAEQIYITWCCLNLSNAPDLPGLVPIKRIPRVKCEEQLHNDGTFFKRQRSRIFSPAEAGWVVAVISYLHLVADSLESLVANSGLASGLCCAGLVARRTERLGPTSTQLTGKLAPSAQLEEGAGPRKLSHFYYTQRFWAFRISRATLLN